MRWLHFFLRTWDIRTKEFRYATGHPVRTAAALSFALLCVLFPLSAGAEAAYDGYIVKLQSDVATLAAIDTEDALEPLVPEHGLYTVSEEQIETVRQVYPTAYIEPDYLVTLFDLPSEETVNLEKQWSLDMLNFPFAWRIGALGEGVRVGIIDSGASASHPALAGRIAGGYNFCENTEDYSDTANASYHGTAVAGIIAANTIVGSDQTAGYSGAVRSDLYILKAFSGAQDKVSYIVDAIYKAVEDFDCDVLNMSFGLTENVDTLKTAIDYAAENGVILLAAVGNDGKAVVNYPAGYDSVIGVGAVDRNKAVADYSNFNESVFISAPGSSVYIASGATGAYKTGSGTSFATPHVTAGAAVLRGMIPDLTGDGLKELLRKGAEDLGDAGYDIYYGWGLMDMEAMQGLYRTGTTTTKNTVSFRLANYTEQPYREMNILAAYQGEDMTDCCLEILRLEPGATAAAVLSLTAAAEDDVTKWLRWDSPDTILPLADAVILSDGETTGS